MTRGSSGRTAPAQATARPRDVAVVAAATALVAVFTLVDLAAGVAVDPATGERIGVLNPALWPFGLGAGLVGMALAVWLWARASRRGGWTRRAALAHAGVVLATSLAASMALSAGRVIDPRFTQLVFGSADGLAVRVAGVAVGALVIGGGVWVAAIPFTRLQRAAGIGWRA
ncbi:hypothetical protein [Microbacterium sp. ZXX196]|uniref:hypothetical protein n=1 Tax=Microbacterium sp. ZXX196 TaxID=2609291 RepID=UPI0012B8E4DA|nr:hypothetical protein [Microbacterium sp. ZXX196]MTE23330.1 hypothetical protein [Microbacterium sp. ZXX196]